MRKFFSLITAVLFAGSMMADSFKLVTDASALADGDEIIIVNAAGGQALSTTQQTNNRRGTEVEAVDDVIEPGENVQIITLVASGDNWQLQVGEDAFLYAPGGGNYLRTTTATDAGDKGIWALTLTDGAADFVSQGDVDQKFLRFNPNDSGTNPSYVPMFSCYKSTSSLIENLVRIYKKEAPTTRKITLVAGPWDTDDAKFAAATLPIEVDPATADMTTLIMNADKIVFTDFFESKGNGVYEGVIPAETKTIAFGRFAPEATSPIDITMLYNSSLFWNFSNVLALDPCLLYTIYAYGESGQPSKGFWGEDEVNYFLTGTFNEWAQGDAAYQFSAHATVLGYWVLNTTLEENAGIKVVGVHTRSNQIEWFPDGMDNEYVVDAEHAGNVTITFRPDGAGGALWHEGYFLVEPVQATDGIDIKANMYLNWTDVTATQGWWQMNGYDETGAYYFSLSNYYRETAAGYYTMDDMDASYSYIIDINADSNTRISFTECDLNVMIDDAGAVTILGYAIAEDGNTYNFDLYFLAPKAESEVTVTIADAEINTDYLAGYGLFGIYGTAEDGTYAQFWLWDEDEKTVAGTYNEYDFDDANFGCGLEIGGTEQIAIYSANLTVVDNGDGTYVLSGEVLGWNNVLYHITMTVGGSVVPGELLSCIEVYDLADDAEAALDEVVVTYVSGRYCWVRDVTGAMLVYLPTNPATTFAVGDVLTGVVGTKTTYKGLVEVTLTADQLAAIEAASGDAPEPEELQAIDEAEDMNKYIILKGVGIKESIEFTTSSSGTAVMDIDGTEVDLFNKFKLAYSFDAAKTYDIIGIVSYYNKLQVHFISATENGGEQGIEEILATGAAAKVLRNNQILILKGDKVYNVMGTVVR